MWLPNLSSHCQLCSRWKLHYESNSNFPIQIISKSHLKHTHLILLLKKKVSSFQSRNKIKFLIAFVIDKERKINSTVNLWDMWLRNLNRGTNKIMLREILLNYLKNRMEGGMRNSTNMCGIFMSFTYIISLNLDNIPVNTSSF